jgi:Ca-activated chloride channel family protein
LAGLQMAAEVIVKEPSQVRHIVLLTDGGANPEGIPELTEQLADQDVTISVVAIGYGYAPFLEDVARIGGGRFHFADDASVIPQIFAQETSLASRSYIVEETFIPRVTAPSPILEGLTELPALRGYVATSPKLTAQTVLRGGEAQDPILAQWQYGLGRVVVWTSDAKGQWAVDWLNWPEFPRFWSQVVRWTIVEGAGGALESQVRLEGNQALVRAEVLKADGGYRNNLDVTLSLVDPNLVQQTITLHQTAPGLYEGAFRPEETGTYLLYIAGQEGEEMAAAQTRGFVMAYSPEYRTMQMDETLLSDLATIGNGRVLSLDAPTEAFAHTLPPAHGVTDLWPWFLAAAILLLPLDVGLRRVIFGSEDLRRLWGRLWPQFKRPARPQPQVSSASQLLWVKEKQQFERPARAVPTTLPGVDEVGSQHGSEISVPKTPSTTEPKSAPEAGEETTVQRLMRVKQKRRKGGG